MKFYKAILFIAAFCASVSVASATGPVNVTDFGAVGNGVTDNLSAIQTAIDSAANSDELDETVVYFPAGYYNVSGTLTVPSNVRLQGMGSFYNCQVRLTVTGVPLFEVGDGESHITFKDLTLYSLNGPAPWPRTSPAEAARIRTEDTTGISLKAGTSGISSIVIENVRISRFNHGVSATSSITGYDASVSDVRIRNYASDGNEYSLYTNTRGADGWDVQNMDVYPMYDKQNGIFLQLSGQMRFLQLSCAGFKDPAQNIAPGVCAKLWGNGDTYFRNMHVEGPRLGFCVGSYNCDPSDQGNMGENASLLTIENSAAQGEFHRLTNLVSINNRFWLDWAGSPRYQFFGTGAGSPVRTCGDVWVSFYYHMTQTTVHGLFPEGYPGLTWAPDDSCVNSDLTSVPVFNTGYTADTARLSGDVNVTDYCSSINCTGDVSDAFRDALKAATPPNAPIRRIFVPSGSYDVNSTLELKGGETFVGESGSFIHFKGSNIPLFKVKATSAVVKGITWRNLVLTADPPDPADPPTETVGIELTNDSTSVAGAASDFQIQNVDFNGFTAGIVVQPACGSPICTDLTHANPMFDSVSLKDADFSGNQTAIIIRSQNASNWNLENIRVDIPDGAKGVQVDGIGHLSIRDLSCTSSGTGSACVSVQRQNGLAIEGLSATNVDNALVAQWENGWTQFPFTLRNSDLTAGVYFQGRVYLNSVNNLYPAKLSINSPSKVVKFGADREGAKLNVAYGGMSDIFSCNDTFIDTSTMQTQGGWAYTGTLLTAVTICN
jgi:hypothetical protein